jgi:N-acetylglutamate synthase-like GNAT family acetyltransferase
MVRALADASRDLGVRELWLLTATADRYFLRFGFAVEERNAVPAPLLQSVEFRGACPATAVVMRRPLADHEEC